MPERTSESDDPILSAKRVRDQVIANHDPSSSEEAGKIKGSVPLMPPEYEQLTQIIVAMRNLIERETRELATANPQWDRWRDARLMVFSNILAVIDSVMVGLVFTKGVLPGDRFWSEYGLQFHSDPPAAAKAAQHDVERRLEGFIKVGFVQVLFSVVENAMRSYLRALDPLACAAGTANFQSVYTTLLKRLSMPIPDATELLDLWREVRNVVHNNGVYFNTKGDTDKTIVYKGRTYNLRHGKKVDFVDWGMCFRTAFDVRSLLLAMVNDEVIKNHHGLILDASHLESSTN